MKNFLIMLFVVLTFIFNQSFGQNYGWINISANLPDYPFDTTIINNGADTIYASFSDISFINDNEGWVSTWHPWEQDSAAILHTIDGGDSWEVQMIFRACTVIHMVNESLGWAGTDHGLIFMTTDGGENWSVQGVTGGNITNISFVPGTDTGYLCTYDATFMHRVNPGGVNPINLGGPGWWVSISAPSNERIWISGNTSVECYEDGILTDQPITSATYNSISFIDNNLGWGCGYEGVKDKNQGVLAGCVGKNIPWVHLQYTDSPMNNIFALDDDHVWAVGCCGQIYYSENASQFDRDSLNGANWWSNVVFTPQSHPRPDLDLWIVYFTALNNGYAAGGYNTLLRYTQITTITESSSSGFQIFPNPTSGKFSVTNVHVGNIGSWVLSNAGGVEIIDLFGKVMKSFGGNFISESMEFNVSDLPNGIYFLRILAGNQSTAQKIIIQK